MVVNDQNNDDHIIITTWWWLFDAGDDNAMIIKDNHEYDYNGYYNNDYNNDYIINQSIKLIKTNQSKELTEDTHHSYQR